MITMLVCVLVWMVVAVTVPKPEKCHGSYELATLLWPVAVLFTFWQTVAFLIIAALWLAGVALSGLIEACIENFSVVLHTTFPKWLRRDYD